MQIYVVRKLFSFKNHKKFLIISRHDETSDCALTWSSHLVETLGTDAVHVVVNEAKEHIHIPVGTKLLRLGVTPLRECVNRVIQAMQHLAGGRAGG